MGDFSTPLSVLDKSTRQRIIKDFQGLNVDLDQADLIDIYRTLHPKSTEYTFSAPHCTYSNDQKLEVNHSSANEKDQKS